MNAWYIVYSKPLQKEANHGRNRHHLSVPDTGPAFRVSPAVTDAGRVTHA